MVTFAGCGKTTEEIATEDISTDEIIERVNSTGIITDEQAESLSKVEDLRITAELQPLIDKYKNQ